MYAFYLGFVAFAVPAWGYTHRQNQNGRVDDLFASCFASLFIIVLTEHLVAYLGVRSWNAGIWIFFGLAVLFNWIDVVCVEYIFGTEIDKRQFPDIMAEFKFWLVVVVATGISTLPVYVQKTVKMLLF